MQQQALFLATGIVSGIPKFFPVTDFQDFSSGYKLCSGNVVVMGYGTVLGGSVLPFTGAASHRFLPAENCLQKSHTALVRRDGSWVKDCSKIYSKILTTMKRHKKLQVSVTSIFNFVTTFLGQLSTNYPP